MSNVKFYFDSEAELIEHCKKTGLILYVDRAESSSDYFLVEKSVPKTGDTETWHQLFEAAPASKFDEICDSLGHASGNPSRVAVSSKVFLGFHNSLKDPESDLRRVCSIPMNRAFVYIDVSDFSKFRPFEQVLVVNSLIRSALIANKPVNVLEAQLCIGDGYIYVLRSPKDAVMFSASLASQIQEEVAYGSIPVNFHFRMSIHFDEVFHFWDAGRNDWNYIGKGINGGERVLTAMGKGIDDVIYASDEVIRVIRLNQVTDPRAKHIIKSAENKGRHIDKHGNPWRVYLIKHDMLFEELRQSREMEELKKAEEQRKHSERYNDRHPKSDHKSD